MKRFENTRLHETYYTFESDCGLPVFVFPKALSMTCAFFGTRYGSVDNCFRVDGESDFLSVPDGIAHYLEHRMFTQADGSDVTEQFSQIGADTNAFTSYTKTVYLGTCTEHAEDMIETLLRFVTEPYFTEELVEKERGIIIQEILMGEDNPYSQCFDRLMSAMYHHCSARVGVAGSVRSVSEITAEMLNRCYETFYNPSNMALVVCGDITPDAVEAVVNRTLPSRFVSKNIERRVAEEPPHVAQPLVETKMAVAKPIFSIGVKDPVLLTDGTERIRRYAAMSILCDALFCRSGRLYNSLFEEGLISPDFSFYYTATETFAYTAISGEADDPELVLERIKAHIRDAIRSGIPQADIERSRRVLYSEFVKDFDSTEEIAYNLIDFVFDDVDLLSFGDILMNTTYEEMELLLKEAFADEYISLSVVWPKRKDRK